MNKDEFLNDGDFHEYIDGLASYSRDYGKIRSNIDEFFGGKFTYDGLKERIENRSLSDSQIKLIASCISTADLFLSTSQSYSEKFDSEFEAHKAMTLKQRNFEAEIERQDRIRQLQIDREDRGEERKATYVDWAHKMVRWCGGFAAAVLMYSCAVYLTELNGGDSFFKLPLIDLIKEATK